MTMLQRLVRIVTPQTKFNSGFERYYSELLQSNGGAAGAPSAREAQKDLNDLRQRHAHYPYM